MKLNGAKIQGRNVELVVIPRGDDPPIVFKAQAVLDIDDFESLCPVPKPPTKLVRGGQKVADPDEPKYKAELADLANRRWAFMMLRSLAATENLEWETVDLRDSSTWLNWKKELQDAGFNYIEIQRIEAGVLAANALDESKVDEARKRFLATQQVAQDP